MKQKIMKGVYRVIRWLVWLFYPEFTVEGVENLPQEPCLVVGNHSQLHGPVACELYFPGNRYTWCDGRMMHLKEVPDYAFQDFWSEKPGWCRWFFRILSYIIAPLSVCIFNNARTIGVYRDNRILTTFKTTLRRLKEGANVIVFPECGEPGNHIVYKFQENFTDIARLYYKQTGKALPFVPLYIAPALHKMYIGKPVYYNKDIPMDQQRAMLCDALTQAITQQAMSLPRHRVVPYPNIPRSRQGTNL